MVHSLAGTLSYSLAASCRAAIFSEEKRIPPSLSLGYTSVASQCALKWTRAFRTDTALRTQLGYVPEIRPAVLLMKVHMFLRIMSRLYQCVVLRRRSCFVCTSSMSPYTCTPRPFAHNTRHVVPAYHVGQQHSGGGGGLAGNKIISIR